MGGKAILGLSRLDYPLAKTGGAVNGGRSPFILTVDWIGWLCYLIDKLQVVRPYFYLNSAKLN